VSTARRRVVVNGRVQGVMFRDSARRRALARGVAGWVSNLPDGSVEAVFEGDSADLDALVAWMRHGPPHARVETTHVSHEEPVGERGFRVR
jgi:acylphosphatase